MTYKTLAPTHPEIFTAIENVEYNPHKKYTGSERN